MPGIPGLPGGGSLPALLLQSLNSFMAHNPPPGMPPGMFGGGAAGGGLGGLGGGGPISFEWVFGGGIPGFPGPNDGGNRGRPPAAEAILRKLQVVEFHSAADLAQLKESASTCNVCLDKYTVGQKGLKLPCGHVFHPDCGAFLDLERGERGGAVEGVCGSVGAVEYPDAGLFPFSPRAN